MAEKLYKTLTFGYKRVDASPLEADSLFDSLEAAQNYALTNPTSYAGRQIAVVTDDGSNLYIINPDKTLKEVGADKGSSFAAHYKFTYENANEDGVVAVIIPAGCYMEDVILIIEEPFDDDTMISVGTATNHEQFLGIMDNDPQPEVRPASFEVDCNFVPETSTPVYLYIKPGATKGSGILKITVA